MSSETSTDVRLEPDAASKRRGRHQADESATIRHQPDDNLHPWQFFVLAALGCATAATFIARGQGITAVIMLSVIIATAAVVAMAALRALRPVVGDLEDRTVLIGQRTRAALEREKALSLRAIKELEFDHAMGKLSESDWHEMSARLRARAAGLIRQLDAGAGYRDRIERDLAARLAAHPAPPARGNFCTECGTKNEADAKFCKNCGHKL